MTRIVVRVPQLYVSSKPHVVRSFTSDPHVTIVDRTYILGENVKFIEYDRHNKGRLLIHYNNDTWEEVYNDTNQVATKKVYDKIVDALKQNGSFIEYE